jgi:hypothetical protein
VSNAIPEEVDVRFTDRIIERNRAHRRELTAQRDVARRWNDEGRISTDALLELSSVDATVAFFDDRLEYQSRLGPKHGVVPYDRIRAARLKAKKSNTHGAATFGAFTGSKKMVLTVSAHRAPVTFDFRTEPLESVREAFAIIRSRVTRTEERKDDGEDTAVTNADHAALSRADALWKLAKMRRSGLLSEEEYAREKARVLGE